SGSHCLAQVFLKRAEEGVVKTPPLAGLIAGTALYLLSGTALAQNAVNTPDGAPPAPVVHATESFRDYLTRTVKVTGVMRVRWEGPDGSDFTVSPADSYTLSRLRDRKSTRLNSSHANISYAVF